jgi:hypothetical protein
MELGLKNSALVANLVRRLHDPSQLRWILTGLVSALGGLVVYLPLAGRADDSERKYAHEKKRLNLVKDIEHLRDDYKAIKQRIPAKSDASEWAAYLYHMLSDEDSPFLKECKGHLRLVDMNTSPVRNMAPYRLAYASLVLEGEYCDLDRFLRWLDTNERLLRVDNIKLEVNERGDALQMRVVVVGVLE